MMLTAFDVVNSAPPVGDHVIRTGDADELARTRLITADRTRYAQPRNGAVVVTWTTLACTCTRQSYTVVKYKNIQKSSRNKQAGLRPHGPWRTEEIRGEGAGLLETLALYSYMTSEDAKVAKIIKVILSFQSFKITQNSSVISI